MSEKEFHKLINVNKYQVFLFISSLPLPLSFAVHSWFVVNLKGKIHRWEFGKFRGSPYENGIGVLKDFLEPTEGMNIFFWRSYPRFDSKLVNYIEGYENSVAGKMALFIEEKSLSYPLKHVYSLTGPNSNTYTQWILDKFPDSGLKLPFNAFGKGFIIDK